jgi:nuclear transcription factor Y, alpha
VPPIGMMESTFAPYPQAQPHHPPGHMQPPYPPSQNGTPAITSPSQQQVHPQPTQTSPLMSQGNPYAQHPAQSAPGHPQQMPYNTAAYPMPGQVPYHLSASQAAAMASAAATGQHYYPMNQNLPVAQDVKRGRSSPQSALQQQLPARRMSHVGSPVVQTQQPGLPNARGVPPQPSPMQPPPPPEAGGPAEDTPLYVNAKQFHRILKRRNARQKLEEALRLTSKARKPYLHESRHNHAMRRPRGPGGRFLTSDEVMALQKKEDEDKKKGDGVNDDSNGAPGAPSGTAGGSKRKSTSKSTSSSKKSKADNGYAVKEPNDEVDDDDANDDG